MVIALNAEQAQIIVKAIEVGVVQNVEEAAEVGMAAIRHRLETRATDPNDLPYEEWSVRFHAWVNRDRPEAPPLSDEAISRESIYADRGL
jgi:hypothetical protein